MVVVSGRGVEGSFGSREEVAFWLLCAVVE